MGFHVGLWAAKGAAQIGNILYMVRTLLRQDMLVPQQITDKTRGTEISGKAQSERQPQRVPTIPLNVAAQTGRLIFYDEFTKADPGVVAAFNQILEYDSFTATSGEVVKAKRPGFGLDSGWQPGHRHYHYPRP